MTTIAQTIVASNQEFIDKLIKENESLLIECGTLKQQISQTKIDINRIRAETVKSIEPKIKQLIQSQKEELENQKKIYQPKIDSNTVKFKEEKVQVEAECEKKIKDAEMKSQKKIEKMKSTANNRENELNAAISEKLQLVPQKVEKAKKKILANENIIRSEWEKIITDKLQKEFHEKTKKEQENVKSQQEKNIINIVNQLESSTVDEARILTAKIEKESKQHNIAMNKLRLKYNDIENELNALAESNDNNESKEEYELQEMKNQMSKCKCNDYHEKIKNLNFSIADIEEEILEIKRKGSSKKLQDDSDKEELNNQMQIETEKTKSLLVIQKSLQKEFDQITLDTQKQINELETQQKAQLAAIGERVKQTVAKKDQVIAQLKDKLSKFGFT